MGDLTVEGYKVVVKHNKTLKSIGFESYFTDLSLRYEPGIYTKPKLPNSKLFFFQTYEDALKFLWHDNHEIWKCKVKNPKTISYMSYVDYLHCVTFWKYTEKAINEKKFAFATKPPKGTMVADKIKLINRVYP